MTIRHGFMDQYKSADSERSMYKNIPITLRHHPFVKGMLAVGCRVRYRGPRVKSGMVGSRYHTLKRDATRFSIYPPSRIRVWSYELNGEGWTSYTYWPWNRPHQNRLRELESALEAVRRERYRSRTTSKIHSLLVMEQEILDELNRYNSVTV